jgi:hypothetical protein
MDAAAVSAVVTSVDFATIIVGIGGIGAAIALVLISIKGARLLLGMLK